MSDDVQSAERELLDALRTSEARFRAICETAPLGIYVSELDAGVVYVNPAMQRIFGRSQEELRGRSWQKYLHPDDAANTLSDRASRYRSASPIRSSARYIRSDGTVIWTQLHAAPILEGSELRGYVGVLEDITEHKALQAQLVMAERLASVGTLAAGVAHEVNTPLAVTLGNLEWAQRRLAAAIRRLDPSAMADLVEELRMLESPLADARDAAQRVSVIMKDLTLFSRPEASEQGAADLERVLASAARLASHELRHRARLVHDYAQLPWVRGSEARLGQVFLNLLINAAHAIPEGRPEEHEVRIQARAAEPGQVAVEVRDTGEGIDPGVLDRIFDPFFTTKPQSLGTGLGLAICHRIVSSLGGRIEVDSEPSRGTVFRVLLPTSDPLGRPSAAVPDAPQPVVKSSARVLVIDDDEQLLSSLALVLGDDNEVRTMKSARAALAHLQSGTRYDVVLCDLMMPDMSGMEFHARLVQSLPELADQVVFLTGGAVTQAARTFLETVPNVRLAKPFGVGELQALVASRVRPMPG